MLITSRRTFVKQASLFLAGAGVGMGAGEVVITDTAYGKIRGSLAGDIKVFKGVPYGADTSGANRFMPRKSLPGGPPSGMPWIMVRRHRLGICGF